MKHQATQNVLGLPAIIGIPVIASILSGVVLNSSIVSADVVDKVNITVPMSCTVEGTGMNTHNAEINNGQYNSNIGETTLKAFCNDTDGFAIYAIGYTDNLNGKNVLTSSELGPTHDIVTGTAISGANSNWAMKLSTISSPTPTYPITIENSFDAFHNVPNTHTLVAKRTSGTDIGQAAEGSTLKTTYQAYVTQTQPAGTYTGQVKYTLVHPHNNAAPLETMLDTGKVVAAKMKTLAAGTTKGWSAIDESIKTIRMADSLPANFEATEANTVSVPESKYPIYIFFDNTNDAGIMYFYTEGDAVGLNPDSSGIFVNERSLADISGVIDWDTSNVTNLELAFASCHGLTSLHGLENWDVSNVTNMYAILNYVTLLSDASAISNWNVSNVTNLANSFSGTNLTTVEDLANWDTSNVTNLSMTFSEMTGLIDLHGLKNWDTSGVENMEETFKGNTSLTDASSIENWNTSSVTTMESMFEGDLLITSLDLSNWDTSSATNMASMFNGAKALVSIDTTGWDTGNVTTMERMFQVGDSYAGNGQLREIIGIGDWNTSNVTTMNHMFYGAGQMIHYDIADWNVSKVKSFDHAFCDNHNLESLDLSRWDVSSLQTIFDMFDDARKLTTIGNVSHWNTSNLLNAGGWLNGAESFVGDNGTLDLSGWDTSNVVIFEEMFRATKLQVIDLSGWLFDSASNDNAAIGGAAMSEIFKDTSVLNTVYLSQTGLDSFNAAVSRGVDITNMWSGSAISGFTVKQ